MIVCESCSTVEAGTRPIFAGVLRLVPYSGVQFINARLASEAVARRRLLERGTGAYIEALDPVAQSFLGALHEHGPGVANNKNAAREHHLTTDALGACRSAKDAAARLSE